MKTDGCQSVRPRERPKVFATTRWSVVLAAGEQESASGQRALETLCRGYWYPIYVYVRRKGYEPIEAEDLTQEFFAQLIRKQRLRLADREKGKFRTFLLANLDYFLAREWARAHRQKRGGRCSFIPLNPPCPEERYRHELAVQETAESNFLRQWALTVLEQTMSLLGEECAAVGKGAIFRALRPLLAGEEEGGSYRRIGDTLGMSEGALRVAAHRLRRRYGELLRNELAQTVNDPREVDEELRFLLKALRS